MPPTPVTAASGAHADDVADGPPDQKSTLSGRPAIDGSAPPRTPVSRGAIVAVSLLALAVVGAVAMVLLQRGPDGTDVRAMEPGQCYVESDVVEEHGRPIPYGRNAPCLRSSPRVVAVVDLPLGSFPGAAGLAGVVETHCGGAAGLVILPNEQSWANGDRTVACIALPSG